MIPDIGNGTAGRILFSLTRDQKLAEFHAAVNTNAISERLIETSAGRLSVGAKL